MRIAIYFFFYLALYLTSYLLFFWYSRKNGEDNNDSFVESASGVNQTWIAKKKSAAKMTASWDSWVCSGATLAYLSLNTNTKTSLCLHWFTHSWPIVLAVCQSGLSIWRVKRSSVRRTTGVSQPALRLGAAEGLKLRSRFMCSALCSLVGLWSLCEMSTGVNEYPLLQSPVNPHNKMHNSLIKSATAPGGRPLAFSSQPHRDFSRFDVQSCQPFISLYTFLKMQH